MDDSREEELLTQIAAGTDICTALAALPPEDEKPNRPGCLPAMIVMLGIMWLAVAG